MPWIISSSVTGKNALGFPISVATKTIQEDPIVESAPRNSNNTLERAALELQASKN